MSTTDESALPTGLAQDAQAPEGLALLARVQSLHTRLQAHARALAKVQKALEPLARAKSPEQLVQMPDAWKALKGADLNAPDLGTSCQEIAQSLEEQRKQWLAQKRTSFLRELDQAARQEGLEMERLGDSPPTLFLKPVTVEIDVQAGRATLSYARERLAEVALDAGAVLRAREQFVEGVREQAVEPGAFFAHTARAYDMVLAAQGRPEGERVDLVDLLVPLALLQLPTAQWRRQSLAKVADYPRHLLAYQLKQVAASGQLAREGRRLELGVATGGSAQNKANVLFVPAHRDEGQYYLSIRFVPHTT